MNALPILPGDFRHRQFRLRFADGRFMRLPHVKDASHLQRLAGSWCASDVYMSVAAWVDPAEMQGRRMKRAGYNWLAKCMISSDFFIDIDPVHKKFDVHTQERTYEEAQKIIAFLKCGGYKGIDCVRTGRGHHVIILDWYKKACGRAAEYPYPNDRIRYVQRQMKVLTKELLAHKFIFDPKLSVNPWQMRRVPGTLHRNGSLVEIIFPALTGKGRTADDTCIATEACCTAERAA